MRESNLRQWWRRRENGGTGTWIPTDSKKCPEKSGLPSTKYEAGADRIVSVDSRGKSGVQPAASKTTAKK